MHNQRYSLLTYLCLFVFAGCSSWSGQSAELVEGIDVSHFQGDIEWQTVQQNDLRFVIIKASQGKTITDQKYQSNWEQTQKTQLFRGVYHYLDPSDDGVIQAEHFLKVTQGVFGDFPPIVDLEAFEHQDAEEVIGVLAEFLAVVEQHSDCLPIIYTSPNFWSQLQDHKFGRYPLWLADYAAKPTIPNGWTTWSLWQYEEEGKVKGIKGTVDKNRFRYEKQSKRPFFCL